MGRRFKSDGLRNKNDCNEIKTEIKYMGGRWDYGWKEFLRKYIDDGEEWGKMVGTWAF